MLWLVKAKTGEVIKSEESDVSIDKVENTVVLDHEPKVWEVNNIMIKCNS